MNCARTDLPAGIHSGGQRPHIGIVTPGFSASEDDWCIPVLRDLVGRLAERYKISIFALRYPHERRQYHLFNADVISLGGRDARGVPKIALLLRALRQISRQAQLGGINLLHAFWADEPGFSAALIGRRFGIPSIISFMGGELVGYERFQYGGQLGRLNPWLVKTAARHSTAQTVGSQTMAALIEQYFGSLSPILLPLGVDTRLFSPESGRRPPLKQDGSLNLLSVASLSPIKNHTTLLKAVHHIVKEGPQVHLHIIGKGKLQHELEAMSATLDIKKHVTFHGYLPRDRLPDFYRQADALLLPSRFESQSMVVLEAGACGCPVIGTPVGLIPELSPPMLAIPHADPIALAKAILRLKEAPEQTGRLGAQLRQKVMGGYTLEHTVARLDELYWTLLGRS